MKRLIESVIIFCLSVCTISCSSHKSVHKSHAGHSTSEKIKIHSNAQLTGLQKKLVDEALTWQDTPYQYGGAEKGEGTDCSGLVLRVYEKVTGIKLPRNSLKQAEFCKEIKAKEVRPGDLVFFATGKDPDRISHVGLMLDDEQFIHSSTTKGVCISSVNAPYYIRTFKMYGRVPKN